MFKDKKTALVIYESMNKLFNEEDSFRLLMGLPVCDKSLLVNSNLKSSLKALWKELGKLKGHKVSFFIDEHEYNCERTGYLNREFIGLEDKEELWKLKVDTNSEAVEGKDIVFIDGMSNLTVVRNDPSKRLSFSITDITTGNTGTILFLTQHEMNNQEKLLIDTYNTNLDNISLPYYRILRDYKKSKEVELDCMTIRNCDIGLLEFYSKCNQMGNNKIGIFRTSLDFLADTSLLVLDAEVSRLEMFSYVTLNNLSTHWFWRKSIIRRMLGDYEGCSFEFTMQVDLKQDKEDYLFLDKESWESNLADALLLEKPVFDWGYEGKGGVFFQDWNKGMEDVKHLLIKESELDRVYHIYFTCGSLDIFTKYLDGELSKV